MDAITLVIIFWTLLPANVFFAIQLLAIMFQEDHAFPAAAIASNVLTLPHVHYVMRVLDSALLQITLAMDVKSLILAMSTLS